MQNVGIEQHLDAQVPPDLTFLDDTGKHGEAGRLLRQKPLILNLVYYNCTMLCGEALAGLASAMRMVKFDVGNEFDVVTVSFDPRETPEMAAAKKKRIPEALRPRRRRGRLAFPDRPAGVDQRADQGRRLSVSIRPENRISMRTPPPSWC